MSTAIPVPINQILFFGNQNINTTTPKTSLSGKFIGVTSEVFFLHSTAFDGQYVIQILIGGEWRALATGTVEAGKLTAVVIPYYIPEARIVFTASNAPTVFTAEAFGYPSVYSQTVQGDRI